MIWVLGNLMATNSTAATLSGAVTDEGEPVAMAEVMVVNAASNALITSKFSGENGHYQFELPGGVYNLNVSKTSFATVWIKNIDLQKGDLRKDIALTPEAFVDNQMVSDPDGCD